MAKLKSRGRTELFRVEKEHDFTPEERAASSSDTFWEKIVIAVMSDGTYLRRRSAKWPDKYRPGGVEKYDWPWQVYGKLKAGGDPKKALDHYIEKGWKLVSSSMSLSSFDTAAYAAAEAARKTAKAAVRREAAHKRDEGPGGKDGPGFYVTNVYASSMLGKRVAELGPYGSLDEAEVKAAGRLREFSEMKFFYLLPVQVVEAENRKAAEWGKGHVWWQDGKHKGPPVDPRQTRLPGINGDAP